jgi:ABC-2 type transport system permease protein
LTDLIISEWERMWRKPKTKVLLISVPLLSIITALFYQWNNRPLDPNTRFFISALTFPYMNFNVHLFLTLSLLAPLLVVDSFTGEIESGALRTVVLRPYSRLQVFFAKLLALLAFLYVILATILVSSYPLGYLLLPVRQEVPLFGFDHLVGAGPVLVYTLWYYVLGSFTLVALMAVGVLIAMVSRSTTSAIGLTLGFWLFSLMLSRTPWPQWSIQEMQTNELLRLLAGSASSLFGFGSIILTYVVLSLAAAAWLFLKRDV